MSSFVSERKKVKQIGVTDLGGWKDQMRRKTLTMKSEEGFGVELLRVEAVRLLPDLLQLSNAALKTDTQLRDGGISVASRGHKPGYLPER